MTDTKTVTTTVTTEELNEALGGPHVELTRWERRCYVTVTCPTDYEIELITAADIANDPAIVYVNEADLNPPE